MPVFAAIAATVAVVGGVAGANAGRNARRDAEKQAKEEARLEGLVTTEKIRQLRKEEIELAGSTIAAAAGGGVKTDIGSPLMILAEQASEFAYERQVTKDVGASRAATALASGRAVGRRAQAQGYAQAFSGISSAFQIIAASRPPGP